VVIWGTIFFFVLLELVYVLVAAREGADQLGELNMGHGGTHQSYDKVRPQNTSWSFRPPFSVLGGLVAR